MTDQENKKLEGHSYDGIEELDNSLPNWWLNLFYLTIAFSAAYFIYYGMGLGPTLLKDYHRDYAAQEYARLQKKSQEKPPTEAELLTIAKDPSRQDAGKAIYTSKCAACHGPQGQGSIGPNLTDDYWIHGGRLTDNLNVIANGVLDKGMPPWKAVLKREEMYSVVAFIRSIRGTNPPNPKAPQGNLEKIP